ncbi:hypothetical protein D3C87_175460 [compost metagenome]
MDKTLFAADILVKTGYVGLALIVCKIVLFLIAEIVIAPDILKQYSFWQKIRIAMVPFKYGSDVVRNEDRANLKWYRLLCMSVIILLALRLFIGLSVWLFVKWYL